MKRMKKILLALLVMALLLITACGSGSEKSASATEAVYDKVEYPAEEEWAEPLPTAEPSLTEEDFQVTGAVETNRKLIRSASMTLETLHFDQTIADVTALVSRLGGYMESTRIEGESAYSSYSNERSAEFIARVPVSSYDTAQEELAQLGSVRERSENAEDVTDQYYDVQAELDALKIQQERLLTMMEQADKMEDLIALEEALTNVRTRINERTSAIRRYDGLIEYATIRLSINEVVEYSERIEKPATFGQRIAETFKGSLDFIRAFGETIVLGIVAVGPFVLVYGGGIALVVVIVLLCVRAGKRRKKAAGNPEEKK